MAKRPDFIIGGATRAGVDSLIQVLDHHPQIFIPKRPEHKFFHRDAILEGPPPTCRFSFRKAALQGLDVRLPEDQVLHGEMEYDPDRAYAGCPDAKVIFTLRNPVVRAHAQFFHALCDKKETVRSFEHAIEAELSGLRSPDTTGRCWIFKNQYQKHLEHWLSYYPPERILVLIYEEWIDMDHNALSNVEDFLDLPRGSVVMADMDGFDKIRGTKTLHEPDPRKYPTLSKAMQEQLEEIFSLDKVFISNLLNRPIPSWAQI